MITCKQYQVEIATGTQGLHWHFNINLTLNGRASYFIFQILFLTEGLIVTIHLSSSIRNIYDGKAYIFEKSEIFEMKVESCIRMLSSL